MYQFYQKKIKSNMYIMWFVRYFCATNIVSATAATHLFFVNHSQSYFCFKIRAFTSTTYYNWLIQQPFLLYDREKSCLQKVRAPSLYIGILHVHIAHRDLHKSIFKTWLVYLDRISNFHIVKDEVWIWHHYILASYIN